MNLINAASISEHSHAPSRFAILTHGSMQILITLVCGVIAPVLLYALLNPAGMSATDTVRLTIMLSLIATFSAVILLTRMIRYPGVSYAGTILPVFGSTYGIIIAALLVMRESYSNSILFLCFACSVAIQYAIAARLGRAANPIHHLVPGGRVSELINLRDCNAKIWGSPDAPLPHRAIVVADLHFDHNDEWERRIAAAALDGVPIYHYKQVQESLTGRVQIDHLSENVLGSLIPSNGYHGLKRATDILIALLVLPVLLPMLAVSAVAIKLDSPGPVFFRQHRVGFRAKQFRILKFRTMRVSQQRPDIHAAKTISDDERITRVGRFLRRTRIDELPQIWNILCGDMSWIGPRPEALSLSEWYAKEIPFYAYRHIVRPGISGWAQVNQGHVTELEDIHAKLQYDFFYIKHFSYWLDIIIAVRTAGVILNGFGAK